MHFDNAHNTAKYNNAPGLHCGAIYSATHWNTCEQYGVRYDYKKKVQVRFFSVGFGFSATHSKCIDCLKTMYATAHHNKLYCSAL